MHSTSRAIPAAAARRTSTGTLILDEVVEEDGVAMSGPAGEPQEGESVEERRARDRT
ncbi:MAG TPA: hypothetical protein VIL56_04285 [Gaiellaceae bacterium]|jgi:hypothetical protein